MGNGQWAMGNGNWAMGDFFHALCPIPHTLFLIYFRLWTPQSGLKTWTYISYLKPKHRLLA
ncbi:hypothetical protein H6G81_09885 [Scytonema hofmannii FACHB-248]|uniref:Uncharacterized protein n=1 Tax=Scytonema hofmannii FACHB-248 TaxID=1842502 RepID=A0ABR8GN39_9CYAN|nr:hypothetical protein [[Scytonema hofmanni] UTEX B 1581]MBD2604827.1 hypothetical protein [Scytonema hofmannii FACHB-248]